MLCVENGRAPGNQVENQGCGENSIEEGLTERPSVPQVLTMCAYYIQLRTHPGQSLLCDGAAMPRYNINVMQYPLKCNCIYFN